MHTHYDAQVTWSDRLTPSSWNGVTTVLLGNCGVGFAPCHEDQHDMLINLMEGVEDIPEVVLTEGLPWNWHSFPDYPRCHRRARATTSTSPTQVPHAALRVYVMGERGADREPATEAGPPAHGRARGRRPARRRARLLDLAHAQPPRRRRPHIPTLRAEEAELTAIAHAMRETGAGWLQIVSDFEDQDGEFGLFRRLARSSAGPSPSRCCSRDVRPDGWRTLLAEIDEANDEGLRITAQVRSRPTSVLLGFELSQNPFMGRPSLQGDRPSAVRRAPGRAAQARVPGAHPGGGVRGQPARERRVERWDRMFPLGDPPDYEPTAESSIAARAAREGRTPEEVAYDLLLERDGKGMLYLPVTNYRRRQSRRRARDDRAPNTLIGLGDGGAHVGIMCDATATSYTLTHWTRDRGRGALFPVAWAHQAAGRDNAAAIGLNDRGLLKAGMKADINVLDYDRLRLRAPEVVYDLPAGGKRLVQRTDGFDATIVSGAVVYRDGEATGALPGRLVRGARRLNEYFLLGARHLQVRTTS